NAEMGSIEVALVNIRTFKSSCYSSRMVELLTDHKLFQSECFHLMLNIVHRSSYIIVPIIYTIC
ncbi:hypothetical protein MKW98_011093, partial [Papaver atlanticum]